MEARVPPGSRPRPRRGVTLAEQLAASSNLRDLLKLRDDGGDGEAEGEGQGRRADAPRRRTLLDVISDADDGRPPAAGSGRRRGVHPAPGATRGEERVSLMALLERTEQQWSGGGQWKRVGAAEQDEEAPEEEEEKKASGGVGGRCCVCVARGKGAAFIPCGHTFCRACARELRAGRGRCPLCNASIREVLNLF